MIDRHQAAGRRADAFRHPKLRYDVGPLEDFLARRSADAIDIREGSSATITPGSLPQARTVIVLQPVNG